MQDQGATLCRALQPHDRRLTKRGRPLAALVRTARTPTKSQHLSLVLLLGFLLAGTAAFLVAPGGIEHKTHVALHGLCAQRPSHTLHFGSAALPLDARMTGIYTGAVVTFLWLLAAGRLRSSRLPSVAVLGVMAGFVAILGLDGLNALLDDLGWWRPYEPHNLIRLATGLLGGTALGVGVAHLFAVSMWRRGQWTEPVVNRARELVAPLAISGCLAALATSGLPLLYAPLAVGLLLAAAAVWAVLAMVLIALLSDRGWSSGPFIELTPLALAATPLAIGAMAALSGLRLLAESFWGLPQLT